MPKAKLAVVHDYTVKVINDKIEKLAAKQSKAKDKALTEIKYKLADLRYSKDCLFAARRPDNNHKTIDELMAEEGVEIPGAVEPDEGED
jgi:hypothetical protein